MPVPVVAPGLLLPRQQKYHTTAEGFDRLFDRICFMCSQLDIFERRWQIWSCTVSIYVDVNERKHLQVII